MDGEVQDYILNYYIFDSHGNIPLVSPTNPETSTSCLELNRALISSKLCTFAVYPHPYPRDTVYSRVLSASSSLD